MELRKAKKWNTTVSIEIFLKAIIKTCNIVAVKRADSIQSKRKVSSLSDRSDTSEPGFIIPPGLEGLRHLGGCESGGEESPGVLSDEQPPESPSDSNDTDDTSKHLPWIKVIIQMAGAFNYACTHHMFCHPMCYRRNMRASARLIKAVRKVCEI